jgi:hypothetical protein
VSVERLLGVIDQFAHGYWTVRGRCAAAVAEGGEGDDVVVWFEPRRDGVPDARARCERV